MKFLRWNFAKKKFRKRVLQQFFLKKTKFYLKTWCVVKMLIQHLTSCIIFINKMTSCENVVGRLTRNENFGSKTVFFLVFFLRLILFKEAFNCHLWIFYGVILQKKSRASFATNFDFIKKHNSTWKFDAL